MVTSLFGVNKRRNKRNTKHEINPLKLISKRLRVFINIDNIEIDDGVLSRRELNSIHIPLVQGKI